MLKTDMVLRNKESLRNGHNQELPKETRLLNVLCYCEWNSGIEKQHWIKTEKIKHGGLVKPMYQYQFINCDKYINARHYYRQLGILVFQG